MFVTTAHSYTDRTLKILHRYTFRRKVRQIKMEYFASGLPNSVVVQPIVVNIVSDVVAAVRDIPMNQSKSQS